MAKNNTAILLGVGVLVVGGIYLYSRSNVIPPPPALLPQPVTDNTPMTVQTATVAPSNLAPNGIDPTVYATVLKWAQGVATPPVLAFAAAAVPSEYAGMYDLIANVWTPGKNPDSDQIAFWNALRTKYDPNHQYW